MNRPSEPEKKQKLLARCLDAAIESGALDFSINALARAAGTSGRMLVYHFGSKLALQQELIALLEQRLRENLLVFQQADHPEGEGMVHSLLDFWRHLTRPEMHGLLILWVGLIQRAAQEGDTREFFERERRLWIEFLEGITHDHGTARSLYLLLLGALLDYLATGCARSGEQTIRDFAATL